MDSLNLITGTKEDDILPGTAVTDILLGKNGDDVLDGGAGNDLLLGGNGDDALDGGDGNDLLLGGNGDDLLEGGDGDDFLFGGKGEDKLEGGDGNDLLDGGKGDDLLEGGDGDDFLFGGKGEDKLEGGDGDDLLDGGKGDDLLDGGAGSDIIFAGKGDDLVNHTVSENSGAKDYYDGGKGFDTLQLTLTSAELLLAQEDIAAFQAFLNTDGTIFRFRSFDLTVSSFEALEIVEISGNTAPVAGDDTITGPLSARIKVAVVGHDAVGFDGSSYVAAAGQLDPALFNATAIAHTATADWAAILAGYDVVVIGDDGIGADYVGSGIFSALRDFVDAGGGVVTTGWFALRLSEYTADPLTADADYITPIASGTPSFAPSGATIDVVDQSHPITSGISNYTVDAAAHDLAVDRDPTATVLATWTPAGGGAPLQAIAVDEVGAGRTAFLGSVYMANDLFSTASLRTGVADQIFERAVTWAAGEQQTAATDEDSILEILRSTLLANDSDVDGDALTIALLSATSNLGAALSINAAGNIVYDPTTALNPLEEGVFVDDSFDYQLADGNGGFDTATVSLKVLGLADPVTSSATTPASFEESLSYGLDQVLASTTADADTLL